MDRSYGDHHQSTIEVEFAIITYRDDELLNNTKYASLGRVFSNFTVLVFKASAREKMRNYFQTLPFIALIACNGNDESSEVKVIDPVLSSHFTIDFDKDFREINYPRHYDNNVLNADNTPANNQATSEGIILGRVLFYDNSLSVNNTKSCASCHQQSSGFTDPATLSVGFDRGETGAHSMRIANARFYTGQSMFWDKRAISLEDQSTQPIQNEVEMGFDAAHGGFSALIDKMEAIDYYPILFEEAFGDAAITEDRIQKALSQFMRSIVSFESKFDAGLAATNQTGPNAVNADFQNFTVQENQGKRLFFAPPNNGGLGCGGCHQAPTMSLDGNSRSNGLDAGETIIFKSPSLKNVSVTGPYMHDGRFQTLEEVIEHYNSGVQDGPALDNRLKTPNGVLSLNLTESEKAAVVAFLGTLTDQSSLTNTDFSDPFISH